MIIAIPTLENKLCSHFGHCETFSFVEIGSEKNEIISIIEDLEKKISHLEKEISKSKLQKKSIIEKYLK